MKIVFSDHFEERIKERSSSRSMVIDTFEKALKLVKKKKIHAVKSPNPMKGNMYNDKKVLKVYLEGCHFVYKKTGSKYLLITFFQTTGNV